MRFNPLIVATVMLLVGGLVALDDVGGPLGVTDDSWTLALIHLELTLAPFLFIPVRGGRVNALSNLTNAIACFVVSSCCVLLFTFSALDDLAWQSRGLSAGAWVFAAGWLSLAARRSSAWVSRARIGVICVFALPLLWHYLVLEYAGASVLHLRALSPNWSLTAGELVSGALLVAGAPAWAAAFALPAERAQ